MFTSQVKSSLRLFRPPLTQTQRGLQDTGSHVGLSLINSLARKLEL